MATEGSAAVVKRGSVWTCGCQLGRAKSYDYMECERVIYEDMSFFSGIFVNHTSTMDQESDPNTLHRSGQAQFASRCVMA
jgi:hypothetical protein